jgi:phosphatidate cytidylyltransferase
MTTRSGNVFETPAVTYAIKDRNLRQRIATALVLIPIAFVLVLLGGLWLTIPITLLAAIGLLEFFWMEKGHQTQGSALIGVPAGMLIVVLGAAAAWGAVLLVLGATAALTFVLEMLRRHGLDRSARQVLLTVAGVMYVSIPAAMLLRIRAAEPDGVVLLLALLISTWGTDSFAYFGGRAFGRRQLAPRLSPNKTVEGAVIGVVGGFVPVVALLGLAGLLGPLTLALAAIAPLAAVAGDLFESAMKRFFRVKDSALPGLDIFPGHGGVLDRIDALIFVVLCYFFALALAGIVV